MIFWLLWRNLRSRLGANTLTALAVALAVALSLAVPMVVASVRQGGEQAAQIFNLLITAKGSPTQAVLNTIFLQETPIGNIPYALYQKLKADNRTRSAIPLGFGDNINGFPLIGTNNDFFGLRDKLTDPAFYRLQAGRSFQSNQIFEAVLGAQAASVSGFRLGDRFQGAHGFIAGIEEDNHEAEYTVVGILAATGGPGDRGVYVPIESLWQDHQQTGSQRQVTAILYTPTKLGYVYQLAAELASDRYLPGAGAQGVFPGAVLGRLLDILGQGRAGYAVLGGLVLLLSLATVAVNTFAAAVAAGRNLAVLRAIGAPARLVLALTLLESLAVTLMGVLLGVMLAFVGSFLAGMVVSQNIGFALPFVWPEWSDMLRALLLLPVAVIFAVAPALAASGKSPLDGL
jgi:putative ABC transport system permease protein